MTASAETRARSAFTETFGGEPIRIVRAPGRVNLIGEHTDYNDGFVLPLALSRATWIAVRAREDAAVHVVAADLDGKQDRFEVDRPLRPEAANTWRSYVRGVVAMLQATGWCAGADLAIAGDIPLGAGLSSSAALEVATARALLSVQSSIALSTTEIARLAQRAECDFVGCQCGIMDQLASACDRQGEALLIDCRNLETRGVPIPANATVMIVHSGVTRGLVDGEYNIRRAQCEQAVRYFGASHLRDVTMQQLETDGRGLDPLAHIRARHVITENARVLAAAEALKNADFPRLGALMNASHASMRDDFAITTPEIDRLAALIQHALGENGGARMTGGGFGGAVVAVGTKQAIARASDAVRTRYRTPAGAPPLIMFEP